MDSSLSFKKLLLQSLVLFSPSLIAAQNTAQDTTADSLQSCLTTAGVRNIIDADSTWSTEAVAWQLCFEPDPASIAYPSDRDQLASSLACARAASVKVSALAGGHSFAA